MYLYIYISYSGIQWQDWSWSSKIMKFEYIRLNVGNPKGAYPIGEGLWLGYRHRRGVLVDSDRYSRKRWSASCSRSTKMHWWVCVRGSTKSDSQRREMKWDESLRYFDVYDVVWPVTPTTAVISRKPVSASVLGVWNLQSRETSQLTTPLPPVMYFWGRVYTMHLQPACRVTCSL